MKAKRVFEFERSNSIHNSLNIGRKEQINIWFRKWQPNVNYKVNDNYDIVVYGDLNLGHKKEVTELPETNKLIVKGDLSIYFTNIINLPNDITVEQDFKMHATNIDNLPDKLSIGNDFNIQGTNISNLPNVFFVGGDFYSNDIIDINFKVIERIKGLIYRNGQVL